MIPSNYTDTDHQNDREIRLARMCLASRYALRAVNRGVGNGGPAQSFLVFLTTATVFDSARAFIPAC